MGVSKEAVTALLVGALALATPPGPVHAQDTRISDLTVTGGDIPVRLVGYGLVVGLDGTGDRVIGGYSSGHTVRSVANLLRRFDVEVPENMLRTRNVAAVLVTAETSPYLRPGGRFDISVASVGDAVSLRGGVLWMTPLVADPSLPPVATAQGPVLVSEGPAVRGAGMSYGVETTASLPRGGLLEQALATPDFATATILHLRDPDVSTASRIADAINASLGAGTAVVQDPGAVALQLQGDAAVNRATTFSQIGDLRVQRFRAALVVIDGRSGTVVAGGDIQVGEAVVSHGSMTLAIGAAGPEASMIPGDLRMQAGVSVQDVAAALHGVAAPPQAIASVFEALRQVGAISAEVTIR
ncbi:MAG: flagellar basal body P-ring protein FlgI [Gemmatimonadota bacterium]|nr:flagellar basal body P-ring protein FlgI [Gemmatimonadota bacterium]MDH5758215.1 flagellar basal body P-ring protein FlgI [Gemmatimonadota bacterium]